MQINGMELKITEGSLEEAFALQKALSDALREKGIKFSLSGIKFDEDIFETEMGNVDIGGIMEMVLSVSTDRRVRECLFALGKRCTIGSGEQSFRITEDFFEKTENRQHYFPIMMEIAKANLSPFFKGLNFGSLIPEVLKGKVPGQKSPPTK